MTLRVRLTLWYTAALALMLAVYATTVVSFLRRSLHERFDDQVHDDIETAARLLEAAPDGTVRWRARLGPGPSESGKWVEVWTPSARLLCREPDAPRPGPIFPAPPSGPEPAHPVHLESGVLARATTEARSVDGVAVWIRAARDEEPMHRELREVLGVMALGLPLALGAAAGGGYFLARRALSPLAAMAERARTITAERLDERLPVGNPRDELGRLAVVFNESLDRLERSFDELRRFTADASHELRTPLTALRAVGEVALRGEGDVNAAREVIGSMLEETDRLARLVDSLLTLSRADAGRARLERAPVRLDELAREVVQHLGVLAEEKGQELSFAVEGEPTASVDRLVLRQALINLVDNAIKYAPERTRVLVAARSLPSGAVLEVRDEGPGIAAEHRARIFERFYRVDPSRSRELGGAGLGLAIAKWAVEANGGTIEVESEPGRGSVFRIVLPAG